MDANDYGVPKTYAYNLTIDQHLKYNMLLDVAYVGNNTNEIALHYLVDYNSKAMTLNTGTGAGVTSPTFGFMDSKTAAPYSRIVELNVKYNFQPVWM